MAACMEEVHASGDDESRKSKLAKSDLPITATLAVHLEDEFYSVFQEALSAPSGRQCMPATTAFSGAVFKARGVSAGSPGVPAASQETLRAAEASFQWLCSHIVSCDALMALFGTSRHSMAVVLDICMVKVAVDCFSKSPE